MPLGLCINTYKYICKHICAYTHTHTYIQICIFDVYSVMICPLNSQPDEIECVQAKCVHIHSQINESTYDEIYICRYIYRDEEEEGNYRRCIYTTQMRCRSSQSIVLPHRHPLVNWQIPGGYIDPHNIYEPAPIHIWDDIT